MIRPAAGQRVALVLGQAAGEGAIIGHLCFFGDAGVLPVMVAEHYGERDVSFYNGRDDSLDHLLYMGLAVANMDVGAFALNLVA